MSVYTVFSRAWKNIGGNDVFCSKIDYIRANNPNNANGIGYQVMIRSFPEDNGYFDQQYNVTWPEKVGITNPETIVPYKSDAEYQYETKKLKV